ncbi:DUF1653 domain-containing protein [Sporosarcina sp. FSL K6-1522]|uniref:DUF1653 domain-containing protein n=1 Tax=Sporosarcina sp. FSL K6-1522 TaxID=2921554 RepID=UPI003159DB06
MEFKHYKGGTYFLMSIADHTENNERLAIYNDSKGNVWARPLEMFQGYVEHEGKRVKRFQRIF